MSVDDGSVGRALTDEERAARKSFSARYGHITRRLTRYQPLKGKTLEFALECFLLMRRSVKS